MFDLLSAGNSDVLVSNNTVELDINSSKSGIFSFGDILSLNTGSKTNNWGEPLNNENSINITSMVEKFLSSDSVLGVEQKINLEQLKLIISKNPNIIVQYKEKILQKLDNIAINLDDIEIINEVKESIQSIVKNYNDTLKTKQKINEIPRDKIPNNKILSSNEAANIKFYQRELIAPTISIHDSKINNVIIKEHSLESVIKLSNDYGLNVSKIKIEQHNNPNDALAIETNINKDLNKNILPSSENITLSDAIKKVKAKINIDSSAIKDKKQYNNQKNIMEENNSLDKLIYIDDAIQNNNLTKQTKQIKNLNNSHINQENIINDDIVGYNKDNAIIDKRSNINQENIINDDIVGYNKDNAIIDKRSNINQENIINDDIKIDITKKIKEKNFFYMNEYEVNNNKQVKEKYNNIEDKNINKTVNMQDVFQNKRYIETKKQSNKEIENTLKTYNTNINNTSKDAISVKIRQDNSSQYPKYSLFVNELNKNIVPKSKRVNINILNNKENQIVLLNSLVNNSINRKIINNEMSLDVKDKEIINIITKEINNKTYKNREKPEANIYLKIESEKIPKNEEEIKQTEIDTSSYESDDDSSSHQNKNTEIDFSKILNSNKHKELNAVTQRQIINGIYENLRYKLQNFVAPLMKFAMELKPASLGMMNVEITVRGGNLQVDIKSSKKISSILKEDSDNLEKEFSSLGYKNIAIHFKTIELENMAELNSFKSQRIDNAS